MSAMHSLNSRHPLCGVWIASNQDETEDYFEAEYHISVLDGKFHVTGIDKMDDEQFVISNVKRDEKWLTFKTLMPSTQRRGVVKMRALDKNEVEVKFTFTVIEIWHRKKSPRK